MVTFKLYCPTKFGQNLYIKIGGEMHAMSYYHNAVWTADLDLPKTKATRYQYVLVNADDTQVLDSPKYRYLPAHEGDIDIEDEFGRREIRSVFETKASPIISTKWQLNLQLIQPRTLMDFIL